MKNDIELIPLYREQIITGGTLLRWARYMKSNAYAAALVTPCGCASCVGMKSLIRVGTLSSDTDHGAGLALFYVNEEERAAAFSGSDPPKGAVSLQTIDSRCEGMGIVSFPPATSFPDVR